MAFGQGDQKIVGLIGISRYTIKHHVASIYHKLGASDSTSVILCAVSIGLVSLDSAMTISQ